MKIDWDIVDGWLEAGSDGTSVAEALGIHPDTLYKHCRIDKETDFSAYRAQKRAAGMNSLRVKRFQAAIQGNTTMMIWLSKQMLGETDKPAPLPADTNYTVEIIDPKDENTGNA